MVRTIALTKGFSTIVDDDDYEFLAQWKWHVANGYAARAGEHRTKKKVLLHRVLMDPPPPMVVDHINGDIRDNRRCNLRICTAAQNSYNRTKAKANACQFKGVYKSHTRWRASVQREGVQNYAGTYETQIEAALAYDALAIKLFGAYASVNFPGAQDNYRIELLTEKERLEGALQQINARLGALESDPTCSPEVMAVVAHRPAQALTGQRPSEQEPSTPKPKAHSPGA
jgi:hypothetical protein